MVLTSNELDNEMVTGYEEQGSAEEAMDVSSLHEQLVRHVHVVSGELDSRLDVWGEHSYARARGTGSNAHMRVLLAPPAAPDDDDLIDVETVPRPPPAPPRDLEPHEPDDLLDEADDWEDKIVAHAPSAAHARLAGAALGVLRDLRLERLAEPRGGGRWARREGAAAAARRLRRALAPHWAGGAAWLHGALAGAPLYAEVAGALRRQVPRLAARLPVLEGVGEDPLEAAGAPRLAGAAGAWLAWAPGGGAAEDARWLRRLGALVHARVLCPGVGGGEVRAGSSPEHWCAALAQEARAALVALLAEAGRRAVIVGGVGAGAALATWLAAGARGNVGGARGLLLLAPPLLTAEGPRDAPDDALADVELPLLAVVGGSAAQSWRGAAATLAGAGGTGAAGAGPTRRVLLVAGADDALRVPRALRRRRRLPQHALDAALAEECARWVAEAAEAPEAPRERAGRRRVAAPSEYEEGRSIPTGGRSIEIIEGRVVSRGPAGAPLALLPPRLAPADIMQLPIVFADDEPATPETPATPTSPAITGLRATPARAYTRVLVAKRGGGGRAPTPRRRAVNSPNC